jgi:UDP-glucose:glycoprotein glucosyltransferase
MARTHQYQQKEPKLARARSIPEWEEYDGEVARLSRSLADRGLIRSTSSLDINALAGQAKPKPNVDQNGTTGAVTGEHARDEL